MTKDITIRLREVAGFIQAEHGRTEAASCLATEAAEEIERLRRALVHIINRSNNGEPGTSKVIDMRRIAEEALKEK